MATTTLHAHKTTASDSLFPLHTTSLPSGWGGSGRGKEWGGPGVGRGCPFPCLSFSQQWFFPCVHNNLGESLRSQCTDVWSTTVFVSQAGTCCPTVPGCLGLMPGHAAEVSLRPLSLSDVAGGKGFSDELCDRHIAQHNQTKYRKTTRVCVVMPWRSMRLGYAD